MSAKEYTLSFLLAAGVQNSYKSVFGEADKCLEKFRDALKSIEKESVAIDKIINLERKLQSSAHISNDEIMKQSHDLELLKQKAGLSGASFADLTKKQQELALASKKARFGMLSKQGESLYSDASQKLMGMASMITATLAKPISDALAMDDARAELRKYSDDWKGIFSDIQGLTTKYASSFEDMTAMGVSNMQAGIAKNREEVSKLIELQSKAQVAFDLEKGQVGQIWADIQSRMKLDIDGTKKVFDLINQYGNVRNVKAVEVSEILQRQGGTLRGLTAFNEKQITALAAAFKEVSPSVEVAATSMGTFVSRLTSGAAATKQQREAMSKLGLNAITVAKQLTGTPEEAEAAVKDIFARINQLADSEKGAVIGQLFGNEAGIKAAVSTLSSNTEVLATNFRIAGNEAEYAGSMDKEFAARSDTASNAIQLAKNNLRLLSGVIGNAFLPQIKELTESFDATSIKEWADENKDLLEVLADMFTKVAEIVGAYFGLKLMVGASIKAYTGFIDIINEAKGAIDLIRNSTLFQTAATKLAQWWTVVWTGVTNGAAAAMAWFNAVMAANPIGAVIVGLAALVALGILVWQNWDTIAEHAELVFNATLLPIFNGIKQALGGVIDFLVGIFAGDWKKAWEGVKNIFAGVFNSLVGIVKTPLNLIIAMINSVIKGINAVTGFSLFGEKIGGNIPLVPFLAKGGIATGPTLAMIGEGSESEAVVPLSKLENMIGGGIGGMNVTFSPTITITGGGGDAYEQVKRGLAEGQDSFKRQLEQLMANQRRLSYA